MSTVIFLGAGASASDKAPVQSELFKSYFGPDQSRNGHGDIDTELRTYFNQAFGIDVDAPDLSNVQFPTFEEALGMLDLAEIRSEAFKDFDRVGIASNSGRIRKLRTYLVYAMATAIKEQIETGKWHRCLARNLRDNDLLSEVSVVSSNYDILMDNALAPQNSSTLPGNSIDYGISFVNQGSWGNPTSESTELYKIHGSLNWTHCPVCSDLRITPFQKGAAQIATRPQGATCRECETLRSPIIVPPTFYKDMSNLHLSKIWRKAESTLQRADQVVFCGYSFPAADTHIKYMLKRAETNRSQPGMNVTVMNSHPEKDQQVKKEEEQRYNRFFIRSVNYTDISFEEFAEDPKRFI